MKVKCRFYCESRTEYEGHETVKFMAIWAGHPEAESFADATPSGSLEVSVTNKAVMGYFKPGKCYNLTLEEVGES